MASQDLNILLPDLLILTAPVSGSEWSHFANCLSAAKKFKIPVVAITVMSPSDARYTKLLEKADLICHYPFNPEVLGKVLEEKLRTMNKPIKDLMKS